MALLSLRLAKGAVTHLWVRCKMGKRDKEIEQERNREREMELQSLERLDDQKITIQHFTHHHPLHRVHLSSAFKCGSCHVSSDSGWAYACEEAGCSYFLHMVCSTDPLTLQPAMAAAVGQSSHHHARSGASSSVTTFAHRQDHPVKDVYSNLEFRCDHCFTNGKGRRYKCTDCGVHLHPVCTKHPTRLSTFMHPQHELQLRTKKRFRRCQICCKSLKAGHKGLNLRVYGCKECKFWVHPTCIQLPQYLLHDLHPMTNPTHELQLKQVKSAKTAKCDAKCGSNCTAGWQYVCTHCSVSFHIECILRHSVQGESGKDKSNKGLANMIGRFSELADASGFGITDVATSLLF